MSAHGGPRHELADAVGWVPVGQPGECFGQPCVRIDAGERAVFDERGDHRPVVVTFFRTREQGIIAIMERYT